MPLPPALTSFAAALLLALPAQAGTQEAVEDQLLPALSAFTEAAHDLAEAATADCRPEAITPAWNAAFDAWLPVSTIRLGPTETAALSIAFWPDTRGFTPKQIAALIAAEDPVIADPAAFAEVSAAARGLFALEHLLVEGYAPGYICDLAAAIARDLGAQALALETSWRTDFARRLLAPGTDGNATYLTEAEAAQALFTQILAALEFTADTRLGRPLGTFERPRPARAEAWRSGRSLTNTRLAVEAATAFARALADVPLPRTEAALARVEAAADRIADPAFQDIGDPQARLRLEVLQQSVRALREAILAELGQSLGVSAGFNSMDGD